MPFDSLECFYFFICIVVVYFVIPFKFRWVALLCASYYFYMRWNVEYTLLLFVVTLSTYVCAIQMSKAPSIKNKKIFFVIGLCINLGLLIIFKYFNFIQASTKTLCSFLSIPYSVKLPDILLPIGISFYSFRTISYLIDVYRGTVAPEKHWGIFALYVSFFPSLLAGPIDRAIKLIPQFCCVHKFNAERTREGLQLILWGLFKKVVIANHLGVYVDSVYSSLAQQSGLNNLLAAYSYTFQIYCDFSGYSDMAIGCAKIMGFDLMQNFNLPYFSTTILEFWRRWHISLSTWFRDYVYIPLGGNRLGLNRALINLIITMLLCGLWHGANWTFIFWGGLHGLLLCSSRLTFSWRNRLYKLLAIPTPVIGFIRIIITFHLVCFLWIFFRANTIFDAFMIISKICALPLNPQIFHHYSATGIPVYDLIPTIVFLVLMFMYESAQALAVSILDKPHVKLIFFSFIFWITFMWGAFSNQQFIYFQF